jgi:hypothetical protein
MECEMPRSTPVSPSSGYFYHASAFGVAGDISRPVTQNIPTQAATVLPTSGGHGSHSVPKYELSRFLSMSAAYVDVGGSFDEIHQSHTTYACSVVEDLNIMDVVKADRIVSRLTVYCQHEDGPDGSAQSGTCSVPTFSITGSHFENLRIAGQLVDIPLATGFFHGKTCSDFYRAPSQPSGANQPPDASKKTGSGDQQAGAVKADALPNDKNSLDYWIFGSRIPNGGLQDLEHNCDIVTDVSKRYSSWSQNKTRSSNNPVWCSAANHIDLSPSFGHSPEVLNYGGLICIPRFGVVFLGELLVHHGHWQFNMLRAKMGSPTYGGITGGGTTGGGGGGTAPGG